MKRSLIGAVAGALVSASLAVVGLAAPARADVVTEGFETVLTDGWTAVNNSSPVGTQSVFQGLTPDSLPRPGRFYAQAGSPTSFASMDYTSTGTTGTISTWMISPKFTSLSNGDTMSFWTRKRSIGENDPDYPDRLEVRVSSNDSCDPGGSVTSVGAFTTTLLTLNPTLVVGGYPTEWTQYTVTLSGLTGTRSGCFGFRYHVTDGGSSGENGDVIGIDTFSYDDQPTDVVAPGTTIDSGPGAGVLTTRSATFAFSSTEPGGFECALDGGAFATCPTPYTATNVTDGAHSLAVRAVDNAGNADPTPATYAFTVDASPPGAYFTSGPLDGGTTNLTVSTFAFSASEPATFECSIGGGIFLSCVSPLVVVGGTGLYSVAVRATDAAGNTDPVPASRSFTVDVTAPDTSIASGPANGSTTTTRTPAFAFTSNEAGVTFACSIDAGPFSACSGPGAAHTTASLADGDHTLAVRATDAGGNVDLTPASRTFTVDATAPGAFFTGGPANGTTTTQAVASVAFTFAASETASFECSIEGAAFAPCVSPVTVSGLDGVHTIAVRGIDAAGNVDPVPASRSFTVDSTAPDTALTSGPTNGGVVTSRTPRVTFAANEGGVTFACSVDGAPFGPCSGPGAAHTTGRLADGVHTVAVRATDAAGNVETTPASVTFTVAVPLVDCTPKSSAVTQATASLAAATAKVATAKKKLKSAKKSRSKAKIKKATKTLKKARAAQTAAQAGLGAAQGDLASCQATRAAQAS